MSKGTKSTVKRQFKGSVDEMITAISLLFAVVMEQKTKLEGEFPLWVPPFLVNIEQKITNSFKTFLGFDDAEALRKATMALHRIQVTALDDLTTLKKRLTTFVKDKNTLTEYLKTFGYDTYYDNAKNNESQSDLINLLFRINKKITPEVKADLLTKNINNDLLNRLVGYAETMNNANINQESFKFNKPNQTADHNIALNNLYNEAMDVVKLAADFFKKDKAISSRLSYAAALKQVKATKPTITPPSSTTKPV
ncbi:hypothetical protein ACFOW1_10900 [Parasediminibacterium paludis]|uniref:Uncharacterized protein n=1 Tax=Parasediminibacterium paludis TaxID=908966 RepID=A0ABV8PZK9_9BACT